MCCGIDLCHINLCWIKQRFPLDKVGKLLTLKGR